MLRDRRGVRLRGPFMRFLLVGAANTVFSFVVFRLVLSGLGHRPGAPALAQASAYMAGIVTGYLAHRRVTFQHRGAVARQMPRFVAVQLVILATTSVVLELLVTRGGLPANVAWCTITGLATVASFLLQRRFVFSA